MKNKLKRKENKEKLSLKSSILTIYVRNVDTLFNKKKPIKHTVEVNIYYQRYREKMEINVIGGQK